MSNYWTENGLEKPKCVIVCAACKHGDIILVAPRHWDTVMHSQYDILCQTDSNVNYKKFDQGFLDQFGEYHTRHEAMAIVLKNGQSVDMKRNGSKDELYSEGLY